MFIRKKTFIDIKKIVQKVSSSCGKEEAYECMHEFLYGLEKRKTKQLLKKWEENIKRGNKKEEISSFFLENKKNNCDCLIPFPLPFKLFSELVFNKKTTRINELDYTQKIDITSSKEIIS